MYNKNNESSYSIELSDEIIADVDTKGKIIGLEILGASKEFDISKDSLKEIKSAELSGVSRKQLIGFIYWLKIQK